MKLHIDKEADALYLRLDDTSIVVFRHLFMPLLPSTTESAVVVLMWIPFETRIFCMSYACSHVIRKLLVSFGIYIKIGKVGRAPFHIRAAQPDCKAA